jgi:hypothetical protein
MMKKATQKRIDGLSLETVTKVYSGKAGKCCCGCSGTHRYNSRFAKDAYERSSVNDRQVKRVINLMKANAQYIEDFGNGVSLELGGRLYCAYTEK